LDNKKKIDQKYLNSIKKNTIDNLIKYNIFKRENIEFIDIKYKKYANVIFDKNYEGSRNYILSYFKKLNVDFVGRFGAWAYLWSDQCFMSGKATAQKIYRENLD
jgi:protoporphyrinogen oxidase